MLKKLREQKGMSQEELAGHLEVTRQAVSRWERSEAYPTTENLLKLSKLFGVSLDELVQSNRQQDQLLTNLGKYIMYLPLVGTMVSVFAIAYQMYRKLPPNTGWILYALMPIAVHVLLSIIGTYLFNRYTSQRVPWSRFQKRLILFSMLAVIPFVILYRLFG